MTIFFCYKCYNNKQITGIDQVCLDIENCKDVVKANACSKNNFNKKNIELLTNILIYLKQFTESDSKEQLKVLIKSLPDYSSAHAPLMITKAAVITLLPWAIFCALYYMLITGMLVKTPSIAAGGVFVFLVVGNILGALIAIYFANYIIKVTRETHLLSLIKCDTVKNLESEFDVNHTPTEKVGSEIRAI